MRKAGAGRHVEIAKVADACCRCSNPTQRMPGQPRAAADATRAFAVEG